MNRHNHQIAIGHTRWATHGDKTDVNAHPHFDHKDRIAVVHNGIIANYHDLVTELKTKHGIIPKSGTDTEVVALLIGLALDSGLSLFDSISKATETLEGAYSFVLISILEPDNMYIFKNCGTMVIGLSDGLREKSDDDIKQIEESKDEAGATESAENPHEFQIVASDTTVFQDYTKGYYNISDREIVKLTLNDKVEHHKIKAVTEERVKIEKPPGIDHYYVMEMLDQPNCVNKALNYGARLMTNKAMVRLGGLTNHEDDLSQVNSLVLAACGTSHYATKYAEILMRQLNCFDYVEAKIASEITKEDLAFKNRHQSAILCVSQSGETMDLLIPFRLAGDMGLQRINVVNKVNSTLARENDCGVFINCGRELSVASTKAYIAQVITLTLVALWFSQRKSYNASKRMRIQYIHELKALPQNMRLTLGTCNEFSLKMAKQLCKYQHIMFLGEGLGEAVAAEGALKMKELTYLHCHTFSLREIANSFFSYAKMHVGTPAIFVVLESD